VAEHVERTGDGRGANRVLVGKAEVKTPIGRLRHKWWIILK